MSPITQILYLSIPPDRDLKGVVYGLLWTSALDLIEQSDGLQRLYWGRSLEQPENVQLHVVRTNLHQHEAFNKSPAKLEFDILLQTLASDGSRDPIRAIRHVELTEQTPDCKALGRGAPYTGTAIYLRPTAAWYEGAWPLWTHIVRHVDGCMGVAGGRILESFELLGEPELMEVAKSNESETEEGRERGKGRKWEGYIVYVGWETVEKHEAYHRSKHFAEHWVILTCGNVGFVEYGHVVFEGEKTSNAIGAKL